jgi:hypothetical protein
MATAASQEWTQAVSQITAKAWSDGDFKKRLLSEPVAVLKEYGLTLPPDVSVKVLEDTDTLYHFSLPPKPTDGELSEEDLAAVAGGAMAAPTCRRCVKTGL